MNRFRFNHLHTRVTACHPCLDKDEKKTISGLAYTVAEMNEMLLAGNPISIQQYALRESQGTQNTSWDVPLENQRGVDAADIWEQQQKARDKVRNYYTMTKRQKKEQTT